jgi:hypothetical protein
MFAERTLFEEMETAAGLLDSGQDFGRGGVRHAIYACYSYLHVRGLSGQGLKALQNLLAALDDVEGGTLPELFDPKLKPGLLPARRWTRSAAGKEVKLFAAGCMDALMRGGDAKEAAAGKVARAVQKWPQVSAGVVKASTVANWRDAFLQRTSSDSERGRFVRLSSSLTEGPRARRYVEKVLRRGPPLTGGIHKMPKT